MVTYHTRLPNITVKCRGTFIQYWSHLSGVVRLSSLFQSWAGVLKAWKFGELFSLVHAMEKKESGKDEQRGANKCKSRRYDVCKFTDQNKYYVRSETGRRYSINYILDCNSSNVIYLVTCKMCGLQYVGNTTQSSGCGLGTIQQY